jgi:hypothetical protein
VLIRQAVKISCNYSFDTQDSNMKKTLPAVVCFFVITGGCCHVLAEPQSTSTNNVSSKTWDDVDWSSLTEEQQAILQPIRARWVELLPVQQNQLLKVTEHWDKIPQDRRAKMLHRLSIPRNARPQQRLGEDARGSGQVGNRRNVERRGSGMHPNRPVDDRVRMREKLKNMTPEERKAYNEARKVAAQTTMNAQQEKILQRQQEREEMRKQMEGMTPEERREYMMEYKKQVNEERQAAAEARRKEVEDRKAAIEEERNSAGEGAVAGE